MTHPGEQYLAEQLQAAYDKVKEWPEYSETGFMDLLTLRNLVPGAIAHLAAEKARADAAEAERDKARREGKGDWSCQRDVDYQTIKRYEAEDRAKAAEATIATLTEQLAEARAREAEALVALKPLAYLLDAVELMGGPSRLTNDDDTLYQCHSSAVGPRSITLGDMKLARATLSRLEKQEGEASPAPQTEDRE